MSLESGNNGDYTEMAFVVVLPTPDTRLLFYLGPCTANDKSNIWHHRAVFVTATAGIIVLKHKPFIICHGNCSHIQYKLIMVTKVGTVKANLSLSFSCKGIEKKQSFKSITVILYPSVVFDAIED
ncbi:hypothetical protein STEG23_032623 [Scotinomys teguina]